MAEKDIKQHINESQKPSQSGKTKPATKPNNTKNLK